MRTFSAPPVPQEFIIHLCFNLSPMIFAPGELTPLGYLFIVHRGLTLYGGRLLGRSAVWGEDVIIETAHLRATTHARALSYVEAYMVDGRTLKEIAAEFPLTQATATCGHARSRAVTRGHPAVIPRPSRGHPAAIPRSSRGHPAVIPQ